MQAGNILCQIRASYQKFTKSERKVADFIFDHAPEVLLMSINDLADACEVGETTVFRFCKTMKLQGYQEFKIQLSLSTQDKNKYNRRNFGQCRTGGFFRDCFAKIVEF